MGFLKQLFLGRFHGEPWSLNRVSRLTWKSHPLQGTRFVCRSWIARAARETHWETKFATSFPLSESERGLGDLGAQGDNSFVLSGAHVKLKQRYFVTTLQGRSSFPILLFLFFFLTFFLNIFFSFSSLDFSKKKRERRKKKSSDLAFNAHEST